MTDEQSAQPAAARAGAAQEQSAPHWYTTLVVALSTALGAVVAVGLFLAVLGVFRWWAAVASGVLVGTAAAVAAVRQGPGGAPSDRRSHAAAAVAVALAVVITGLMSVRPAQHVLLNRDPGVYQATAVLLDRTGRLDDTVRRGGLESVPLSKLLLPSTGAMYFEGGGRIELQFNHGTAAALATAYGLGGAGLLHRVSALALGLALLALYGVCLRLTGRPWLSLVAVGALGCSVPWWYVGRDTYSEPLVVALYWTAVLLAVEVRRRHSAWSGAATGLLLGAVVAVRADAAVLVAPVLLLGGIAVAMADADVRRALRRAYFAGLAVLAAVAAVAAVDLVLLTGNYFSDLRGQVVAMYLLCVLAGVAGATATAWWPKVAGLAPRAREVARVSALPAAVGVAALLVAMWWVRPLVQATSGPSPNELVAALQRSEGLTVEPLRVYSELSVRWLSWYLGPVAVAAGVAGVGIAVRRILNWSAGPTLLLVTATGLPVSLLYFWTTQITPDQPWATRRFVPTVLPFVVLMSVLALASLWPADRSVAPWRVAAGSLLAGTLVVVPAVRTWPVREMASQRSYLDAVSAICDTLGPRATVLVAGGFETLTLSQPLRSWCGAAVSSPGEGFSPADAEQVRRAALEQGRPLWVVSLQPDPAGQLGLPGCGPTVVRAAAGDRRAVEATLSRPPSQYLPSDSDLPPGYPRPFAVHACKVGG
jgi:hypothetical protein